MIYVWKKSWNRGLQPSFSGHHSSMADKHKQLRAALVLGLLRLSAACTVIELQADGFATNAMYLMHAIPIFLNQNGTFFIDSTAFPYTCEEGGGIMDFFMDEELFVPW